MKFKSGMMTQASGSLGGMTAAHNRGGLYLRARSIPVNTNTQQQQDVRNALTQLTTAWGSTLTQVQRDAWQVYADNVPQTNALGDSITLSGIASYVRANTSRLQAALDRVDDAPTIFNIGDFTQPVLGTAAASTNQLQFAFDDADEWANEDGSAMLVYISRPASPSINFFAGPYRFATAIEGDATTAPTSPVTIDTPFPFAVGNKLFVRVRVTRADGRLSGNFRDFAIGS